MQSENAQNIHLEKNQGKTGNKKDERKERFKRKKKLANFRIIQNTRKKVEGKSHKIHLKIS